MNQQKTPDGIRRALRTLGESIRLGNHHQEFILLALLYQHIFALQQVDIHGLIGRFEFKLVDAYPAALDHALRFTLAGEDHIASTVGQQISHSLLIGQISTANVGGGYAIQNLQQ